MRLVGLISGGKDSIYNMLQCIAANHEIVAVANIEPNKSGEIDSYMYQTVGHEAVTLVASALCLPIFRQKTTGQAVCQEKKYVKTNKDEVEDLTILLSNVKKEMKIEGVSVGAIASDYQRTRVENVCARLNLKCFAYLWQRDQIELLQEMIDVQLEAIIIKVACMGLNPDHHLGINIRDIQPHLLDLNKKFGVNVCGEGGEYETLTLDCPLYQRSITITSSEKVILSDDRFAPVGYLCVKKADLEKKSLKLDDGSSLIKHDKLNIIRSHLKGPEYYIQDCVDETSLKLFPQRKAKFEDVLFPFEDEAAASSTSGIHLREYWKECSLLNMKESAKKSSSMSLLDYVICDVNVSSGWCCIGNITGKDLMEALTCLKKYLTRMELDLKDLVFVNIYVRDMTGFVAMNAAYSQFLGEVEPPARSCVETILPYDVGVLLIAVAHKLLSRSQRVVNKTDADDREVLHVQSISHWAPATIGPYSQCVKVDNIFFIAGQIPLIPGSMEILNKPIIHQCKLSLRHVLRILRAYDSKLSYSNIFQAICYVVQEENTSTVISLWEYITRSRHTTVSVVVVAELPKKAQMEWEVIACSYGGQKVEEYVDTMCGYNVDIKRCVYMENHISSVVCNVSMELSGGKTPAKLPSVDELIKIVQYCLNFLKKDWKTSSQRLCILKVFYKFRDKFSLLMPNVLQSVKDPKVVATAIPVVACENPKIFLTLCGVCT